MADEDAIKLRSKELLTSLVQDSTSRLPEPRRAGTAVLRAQSGLFVRWPRGSFRDSRRRTRQRRCGDVGGREPSTRRTGEDRRPDAESRVWPLVSQPGNDATRRSRALLPLLKRTSFASARGIQSGRHPPLAWHKRRLGGLLPVVERRGSDVAGRTERNLVAIEVLASGWALTESDRQVLAGYTGWGGLSIERVESRIPSGWRPEPSALIHEYHTPPDLCLELARVLRPFLPNGPLRALEPSAGIGRFVNALSWGFEGVAGPPWSIPVSPQRFSHCVPTCAWSSRPLSASLLRKNKRWRARWILSSAIRPTVSVAQQPVKTPPDYRERRLMSTSSVAGWICSKAGGIGVFLIPYGLLTQEHLPSLRTIGGGYFVGII